jgi:hypothetical protein
MLHEPSIWSRGVVGAMILSGFAIACLLLDIVLVIFSANILHSRSAEMRLLTPFHARCRHVRLYIPESLVLTSQRGRSSLNHSLICNPVPQSYTTSPECSSTCKPCSSHSSASWPWLLPTLLPTLSWSTEERAMRTIVPGMEEPIYALHRTDSTPGQSQVAMQAYLWPLAKLIALPS